MSAIGDILLAPDVRPFAVAAAIMLVLGGPGWLYGGLIGAAVFMIAQSQLSSLNPVYWQFWLGLFLVAMVFAARGGVVGAVAAARERLLRGVHR